MTKPTIEEQATNTLTALCIGAGISTFNARNNRILVQALLERDPLTLERVRRKNVTAYGHAANRAYKFAQDNGFSDNEANELRTFIRNLATKET